MTCTTSACGDDAGASPSRLSASVHASAIDGHDVPGVRLWADGRELGTTDATGKLSFTLAAPEGARVVVTAACPSAYRTIDSRRELTVRALRAAQPPNARSGLQLHVACEPLELLAALVVRARGRGVAGLPVRVRDRVVGQTDPDGTAHIVLRTQPNPSVTVELDTSAHPEIEPRSPVQTFQPGPEPSLLVFAPSLQRVKLRPRRALAPRVPDTPRRLPYKLH
jgi:hypothetical protein